jgi:hypothetical protein
VRFATCAVLFLLAACHPQIAVGTSTTSHVSGPLAGLVTQPTAAARQDPATVAPVTAERRSYSFWLGTGNRLASIDLGIHLHDVDGESFSVPSTTDTSSARYLLATASVDARFQVPVTRYFAIGGHLGPAAGALVDRTGGANSWGQGFRIGGVASVRMGAVAVFADLYETEMVFLTGPATGASKLTGLTFGIALR